MSGCPPTTVCRQQASRYLSACQGLPHLISWSRSTSTHKRCPGHKQVILQISVVPDLPGSISFSVPIRALGAKSKK